MKILGIDLEMVMILPATLLPCINRTELNDVATKLLEKMKELSELYETRYDRCFIQKIAKK